MDRFSESNAGRMLANTIMPQSREMYLRYWTSVGAPFAFAAGGISLIAGPEVAGGVAVATDITATVVGASALSALWMTTVDAVHQYVDPTQEGWSNRL